MTTGIVSYGAYVPYYRLQRAAIATALGAGGGRGTRAVASYDEDATSMAVEASRAALRTAPPGTRPDALLFATTDPPYLDKTNATAVHAALDLDEAAAAYDVVGSVRSAAGALRMALSGSLRTLVVASDVRSGLPGGADEAAGGDGAAALVVGSGDDVVAEVVAMASSSAEFLDRWRVPGDPSSRSWEERFGEQAYLPLAQAAVTDVLKQAGVTAEEIDHLVVAGVHGRAVRAFTAAVGARDGALGPDLAATVGNTGAAHLSLALGDALDRAQPGQLLLAVSLADGADAFVLRATPSLAARRGEPVGELIASGNDTLPYATFLTWRGMLRREPPRRPEPEAPAAPPSLRAEDWKYAFVGSRCDGCGTRHLPPQRVCVSCDSLDRMARESLADVPATVTTFTVDRLAYSLHPPVVVAVVDFDGGGRFQCEMTDVDPAAVRIGDRVEMTFRRLFTAGGVHNYFWKARPIRRPSGQES